jgi:SAM-dependent methyltransferase
VFKPAALGPPLTCSWSRLHRLLDVAHVPEAVDRARLAASSARVLVGALPDDLPAGSVDLVVLSEVLYYLSDDDLVASLDRLLMILEPGGHLLAVHWRVAWLTANERHGVVQVVTPLVAFAVGGSSKTYGALHRG